MTERFNAGADQTIYGASGVGPAETPSSLTALGVGQGSGQSANAQERNGMIGFEFPIRWDDISSNLSRLDQKKYLDDLVDDMTIRDRELEDFLNTNIVNGIVAGSSMSIDRATGVVTISTTATPIPAGTIMQFAGPSAPTGWLFCDGGLLDRTQYANLFAVIGTTYNIGSGGETSSNFRLPNLQNRVPVGKGAGTFAGLAATGGSETFTIGQTNLPPHQHTINHNHASFETTSQGAHTHTITDPGHAHDYSYASYQNKNMENAVDAAVAYAYQNNIQATVTNFTGISVNSTDSAHKHDIDVPDFSGSSGDGPGATTPVSNLQPFLVLNYIIKP